jgi:hypothetical protein
MISDGAKEFLGEISGCHGDEYADGCHLDCSATIQDFFLCHHNQTGSEATQLHSDVSLGFFPHG